MDSVAARKTRSDPTLVDAPPRLTYRAQAVVGFARSLSASPTSADLARGLAAEGDFACEVLRVLGVGVDSLLADVATARPTETNPADPLDTVTDRALDYARRLESAAVLMPAGSGFARRSGGLAGG